jgi:preprotein translocase subunit SecG
MQTFITIIYVIVALMMVLAILLQAGKGGGLGSALGGGASQGVFGGGGGADFMAKLTPGMAATFMICAMYLAYASAHAGSEFLEGEDAGSSEILDANDEINFEALGINPQPLPTPEEAKNGENRHKGAKKAYRIRQHTLTVRTKIKSWPKSPDTLDNR